MTKSKKRLMKMTDVKRLVSRWFDKRVEIESGGVVERYDGFGDFREWLKTQKDRGDGVAGYQWGRAMKQRGFRLEQAGNYWFFYGLKLKEKE